MSIEQTKNLMKLAIEFQCSACLSRKEIEQMFNISPRTTYRYVYLLRKYFNAPIVYEEVKNVYYCANDWSIEEEMKKKL